MEATNKKLKNLAVKIYNGKKIKIAILGLGSVGCYLLDYLMNLQDPNIVILILGRNLDKLDTKVWHSAWIGRCIAPPSSYQVKAVTAFRTS